MSLLEDKFMRFVIKLVTYPTWKWCKKYGNWYLYNPKHFYETEEDLVPIESNELLDLPISSERGDCRFMFINCNKLKDINHESNKKWWRA